jgi:small subunit ribosomal protein S1
MIENEFDLDDISMDELMAQSWQAADTSHGAVVKGTVIAIDRSGAWVDFGGKIEGLVANGRDLGLQVGQSANFMISGEPNEDGPSTLYGPDVADAWMLMQEHAHSGQPLDVTLGRSVRNRRSNDCAGAKASFGPLNGFIPYSLLSIRASELDGRKGETIRVIVVEACPENNGKLIFDHKTFVREVREKERTELFESLQVGDVVEATVAKFADYGVFVELGCGLQGLLHRSEVTNDSSASIESLLQKGQTVRVKVIRRATDKDGKRQLAFSLKQVKQAEYIEKLEENALVTGTVRRIVDFGTFVELSAEHCVDGLVHRSQYSNAIRHGRKTLQPGDVLHVRVLTIDRSNGRVQLSLRDIPQDTASDNAPMAS